MSEKDVVITNPVGVPSSGTNQSKKPAHLVVVDPGKGKQYFLTPDKPDFVSASGFVMARGFFASGDEKTIKKNFSALIDDEPKENFEEVYFPVHKVLNVKSLVYRAK